MPIAALSASPSFILDQILPVHEIHVIGGPSGAGKTTLLMQFIEEWSQGRPVFGYDSFPLSYCYVACDRSRESTNRTLSRLGDLWIPIVSLIEEGQDPQRNFRKVLALARDTVPELKVLFIDAIAVLCPGGKISDYGVVAEMLSDITRICHQERITVIGLGHATKSREGEGFANPRHRFLGSVAWGGFTDTMIFIEPLNPKNPEDNRRVIHILPRNAPAQTLHYCFDESGRLVPAQEQLSSRQMLEQCLLAALDATGAITTQEVKSLAMQCGITERTAYRILADLCDSQVLDMVSKGKYKRHEA